MDALEAGAGGIAGEKEDEGKGEGGAEAKSRAWFPETFLFEPLVVTDDGGSARVHVRVPDRLTTWRILALAHSRDGAQAGTETSFLGTLYSFGAVLSFTIAHAAVAMLRVKTPDEELVFRGRPNIRIRGVSVPLFSIFGGICTALAWIVIVVKDANVRWAGLGWLAIGAVVYWVYRRRVVHAPLTQTVRAPVIVLGASLEIEYRKIVAPVVRTPESEEALVAAARLAAERGATIAIVAVVEVPLELSIDADLAEEEERADELLDEARALVEAYGVRTVTRIKRARRAHTAIVEEAVQRGAELVVLGAQRQRARHGASVFGTTVDHVLRDSPCRVLIATGRVAA